MALVNCHNCNKSISNLAKICPHCKSEQLILNTIPCPECNVQLQEKETICNNCGADIPLVQQLNSIKKNLSSKKIEIKKQKGLGFYILILSLTLLAVFIYNYIAEQNTKNFSYSENNAIENIVPIPPKIKFELTEHRKRLRDIVKDCNLFGYKKQLIRACNYENNIVRNYAVKLAGNSSGAYNLGQICDVFDNSVKNWHYVNDPQTNGLQKEYVANASETINNGFNGDCDDFAVVICSQILSIGGEARINYASSSTSGHAFTEVNIGKTNLQEIKEYLTKRYKTQYDGTGIWVKKDSQDNNWLNLDWWAQYPGGKYYDYIEGTTFYILQGYCEDLK